MKDNVFQAMDAADLATARAGRGAVIPDEHGNRAQRRAWQKLHGRQQPTRPDPRPYPVEADGDSTRPGALPWSDPAADPVADIREWARAEVDRPPLEVLQPRCPSCAVEHYAMNVTAISAGQMPCPRCGHQGVYTDPRAYAADLHTAMNRTSEEPS